MLLRLRLFNLYNHSYACIPDLSPGFDRRIHFLSISSDMINRGEIWGVPLLSLAREIENLRCLLFNGLLEIFTPTRLCEVFRFTEGFPLSCFVPFIAQLVACRVKLHDSYPAFTLSRAYDWTPSHGTWNKTANEEQRKFWIKHATLSFRPSMIQSFPNPMNYKHIYWQGQKYSFDGNLFFFFLIREYFSHVSPKLFSHYNLIRNVSSYEPSAWHSISGKYFGQSRMN